LASHHRQHASSCSLRLTAHSKASYFFILEVFSSNDKYTRGLLGIQVAQGDSSATAEGRKRRRRLRELGEEVATIKKSRSKEAMYREKR
jgi:hypothetical protein